MIHALPTLLICVDLALALAAFLLTRRRPIYGLALLIALDPVDGALGLSHTTITFFKVTLLAIFAALAADRRIDLPWLFRVARMPFIAAAAVIVATLVSAVHALYLGPVLRETAKACEYLLIFGTGLLCYRADPDRRLLVRVVAGVALVVACGALAQEWTGAPSVFRAGTHLVPRIAGALEGPNQLAGYLGLVIPWLAACTSAAECERRLARVLHGAVAFLTLILFLTFSRGGIIATLVALAIVIAVGHARRTATAIATGGGAVAGALGELALAHGASHMLSIGDAGDTGSVGHRSQLWRAAFAFWYRSPLVGIGAGNYERRLGEVGLPQLHSHANSLFLQSLAEGGVLLFAAVIALLGAILVPLARAMRRNVFALGAFAATLGFALHQTVDFLIFYPKIGEMWWILIGTAFADIAYSRTKIPNT